MAKKFLAGMFVIVFMSASFSSAENKGTEAADRVDVYYFHGGFRCPTCHKLENYTKEIVEKDFKEEITFGKVVFRPVNVEEKGNEHFVKDYGLYTKSVVLSLVKSGKEIKHANLEKVWQYVGNKKKFQEYVRGEMSKFLNELEEGE